MEVGEDEWGQSSKPRRPRRSRTPSPHRCSRGQASRPSGRGRRSPPPCLGLPSRRSAGHRAALVRVRRRPCEPRQARFFLLPSIKCDTGGNSLSWREHDAIWCRGGDRLSPTVHHRVHAAGCHRRDGADRPVPAAARRSGLLQPNVSGRHPPGERPHRTGLLPRCGILERTRSRVRQHVLRRGERHGDDAQRHPHRLATALRNTGAHRHLLHSVLARRDERAHQPRPADGSGPRLHAAQHGT